MTFVPDPPGYEFGRSYRVRLPPGIKAGTLPRTTADGVEWPFSLPPLLAASSPLAGDPTPRPGVAWTFDTAPPLTVVAAAPTGAAPLADLWMPVRITFNRPVVAESAVERFALAADLAWEGDTLVVTPRGGLAGDTIYEVRLGAQARDESGAPLATPFRWTFGTQPLLLAANAPPGADRAALRFGPFAGPTRKGSLRQ